MAIRRRDVYRGKRSKGGVLGLLLFIPAIAIVLFTTLFYSLQQYVVFGQNDIEMFADESDVGSDGVRDFEVLDATLDIMAADYSSVVAVAGADLEPLKALYVPEAYMTAEGIDTYKSLLATYGATGLAFELKPVSGQLMYTSQVETAVSYGLSGQLDMQSIVTELKEEGIYTAAIIHCTLDSLLATRNPTMALKTSGGMGYADAKGMWLDPYNNTLRNYIMDLVDELYLMGFDEIILRSVAHPGTSEPLMYTESLSVEPSAIAAVSGFAKSIRDFVGEDVTLSVILEPETLRADAEVSYGQDVNLFFKLFDRVISFADSEWMYGIDRDSVANFVTVGDINYRYVPMIYYAPEAVPSWLIEVPDVVLGTDEEEGEGE